MRGIGYRPYQKLKALEMWLIDKVDILKVSRKFKCHERTLWTWKSMFDGTLESLANKSKRPHTPHPNSHTKEEVDKIINLLEENKDKSYNDLYGVLRSEHAYKRTYGGFYNFIVRHNLRPKQQIDKYEAKPYDTPEMLGTKFQMDVKFVPKECYIGKIKFSSHSNFFQYTIIDEATRERFIYPYREHCVTSTVDFVKRAITYFGYVPEIIQTDNGLEFTNHNEKHKKDGKVIETKKQHALDILLESLNIKHQLIRAYTPRLNGKVERSHRSDQESFYNHLKFETFNELKNKMKEWLNRYNNRPHASLRNRAGKQVWWTPLQKRQDLLKLLDEKKEDYERVRFIKRPRTLNEIYSF